MFNKDLLTQCKELQFKGQYMDPVSLLDIINKEKEYEVEEVQNYKNIVYNFWYTEKDIEMSTISEYQK